MPRRFSSPPLPRTPLPPLILAAVALLASSAAAQPTVEQALSLQPVQPDIQYDRPEADQTAECTIQAETVGGQTAWVVRGPGGQLLRRFVDTNADNRVDQWCYYLNGIEVYRDIDENFNGKADQYRWLGTAGIRWGLDQDEDRRIDDWKVISPEEVSAEFVSAVRDRDPRRFEALILRDGELKQLGITDPLAKEIRADLATARKDFPQFARQQEAVSSATTWVDFGALRPALLPSGTQGLDRDIIFYDAVIAMVETDGRHGQLPVGTLVQLEDRWRLIPAGWGQQPLGGLFVQVSHLTAATPDPAPAVAATPELQQLVDQLGQLDKQRPTTPDEQTRWNVQRADLLEKLAETVVESDRPMWYRQLADLVCAATQAGQFPDGTQRLERLIDKLEKASASQDLVAYVRYCHLQADYATQIQKPSADYAEIQKQWLENLSEFVSTYESSPEVGDAMLQLAIAHEFAGNEEEASRWYEQVVERFGDEDIGRKAAGAERRIHSVGKPLELTGRTVDGKPFDLQRLRGATVLIHYWATWCQPCTQDMEEIARLVSKYRAKNFVPVGISLDSDRKELVEFLRARRYVWPQLHEPEGLEGSLATQLGVFSLPVMILIGPDGKVIHRGITLVELQQELEKRLQ